MNKTLRDQCITWPLLLALSLPLAASPAWAIQRQLVVTVTTTIPIEAFTVKAAGWSSDAVQTMVYDENTDTLAPLDRKLLIRSSIGAVKAFVSGTPVLQSGTNQIALTVSIDGKPLSATAVEVVAAADKGSEQSVLLRIMPGAAGASGYAAGTYDGTIALTFDTDF